MVHEASRVLPEAPERLKDSHGAFYRWTQAGESIAYGSGGELRVGRCDLGVFVTSFKASRHLEGSWGVMGKLWRVDKALENSEGLRWVRERLAAHNWTKVDWITVRRGHSEAYAFRGVCKYPRKERSGYRINCNVSKHARYPISYYMRVSPLYRNPDGTWPRTPKGHKLGERYASTRNGRSVQWKRLYRPLKLGNEDEVLVFLVAHEAFHYLRKTKQVAGRHGEIEADAFALQVLEQYREELDNW